MCTLRPSCPEYENVDHIRPICDISSNDMHEHVLTCMDTADQTLAPSGRTLSHDQNDQLWNFHKSSEKVCVGRFRQTYTFSVAKIPNILSFWARTGVFEQTYKSKMADSRHLEKRKIHYISATVWSILMIYRLRSWHFYARICLLEIMLILLPI